MKFDFKKPEVNGFIIVRNFIMLFCAILLSILYFTPIDVISISEKIAQHLAAVLIYFMIILWIAGIFAIWEKDKNSKSYKIRSSIGTIISIILVSYFCFSINSKIEIKKEESNTNIANFLESVNVDEKWNINFESIIDFNSQDWKKIFSLFEDMYKEVIDNNIKIKEFETIIFSQNDFSSKESLENVITVHKEAIAFLESVSDISFEKIADKIDKLFFGKKEIKDKIHEKLKESYESILSIEKSTNTKKIDLFKSSLALYEYYIKNYDKLTIEEDWNPSLEEDEEYDKIYNDYEKAYNAFAWTANSLEQNLDF